MPWCQTHPIMLNCGNKPNLRKGNQLMGLKNVWKSHSRNPGRRMPEDIDQENPDMGRRAK